MFSRPCSQSLCWGDGRTKGMILRDSPPCNNYRQETSEVDPHGLPAPPGVWVPFSQDFVYSVTVLVLLKGPTEGQ